MINSVVNAMETDMQLSTILSNFSEDYIIDVVDQSLLYKFRPFNTRMPNFPQLIEEKYKAILNNSTEDQKEIVMKSRLSTYNTIIDEICKFYHLAITSDIPDEQLYSVCYYLYKGLVSEFSERIIDFFTSYIIQHINDILNSLDPSKIIKSQYSKKIYNRQDYITIYDNIIQVIDIISRMDISMNDLFSYILDPMVSELLCNYISDCGDIYKYFFAAYLLNQETRTDMITAIKLKFVSSTTANNTVDPNNTPYFN